MRLSNTVPSWTHATLARNPFAMSGPGRRGHWAGCCLGAGAVLGRGLWVRLSPDWLGRLSL